MPMYLSPRLDSYQFRDTFVSCLAPPIYSHSVLLNLSYNISSGFSGGLVVKNPLPMQEKQEMQVQSLGQEDPQRRKWHPIPVFLPGKFQGQRSLAGYNPGVAKSRTWLSRHKHTHTHTHKTTKLIMFQKHFDIIIYCSVTHIVYVQLFSIP